jgi:hypothetical protein
MCLIQFKNKNLLRYIHTAGLTTRQIKQLPGAAKKLNYFKKKEKYCKAEYNKHVKIEREIVLSIIYIWLICV